MINILTGNETTHADGDEQMQIFLKVKKEVIFRSPERIFTWTSSSPAFPEKEVATYLLKIKGKLVSLFISRFTMKQQEGFCSHIFPQFKD